MIGTKRAAEWARSQTFVNGRFVTLDRATGEVLGQHSCRGSFAKSWDDEHPEAVRPMPRLEANDIWQPARIDCSDFQWRDGVGWFHNGKRVYTLAERREVVRLYHDELMRPARIAAMMGIPRETVRSWIRRARASS